ncbi:MAG: serine esterase [Acidobacteria bacterium]|nr:serine esterase [Acidobacteriota bacterium]
MPDPMTLTRHDDLSLRYVLNVPGGKADDTPLPLVVILHGRGADANDLADVAPLIDGGGRGYRFVFPNAPHPFEPYRGMTVGFSWFDGWPPARGKVVESRGRILDFLRELAERYPIETDDHGPKVVLGGFSQGAMMSLDAGFRTPKALRGIIAMSGVLYEEDLPPLEARREQPVLIIHGSEDEVIPVRAAWRTRAVLEQHGLDPEYHEFAMGHNVTEESLAVVGEFLRRCLA